MNRAGGASGPDAVRGPGGGSGPGGSGPVTRLVPELVLTPSGWQEGRAVRIIGGRIATVEVAGARQPHDVPLPRRALVPGTVNSHCHAFQSLLRGLGDDLDFMGWRDRVLYPFSARLDRAGLAAGAAFAFAEMLLHGVTTCVDFFYIQDAGNENAEAVIAAARETGIRLVLARGMYDWEGAPARYRETPADASRRVSALIAAHAGDATVTVQPAPHSPHGASPAMIRAGCEVAETHDTVFHIHVAEGQYEGERTLREHGATPVRYLDRLGVLGPRTVAVHGVWLDDDEVKRMGERGAALAYCPSSNMFLGDGITRLPELLGAGVRVGLGTDGGCTNNRLSVFEEMRMCALLQRVRLLDGSAFDAPTAFALGTRSAAAMLGVDAGEIAPGRLADLLALDLGDPSLHPPTNLLASIVYAMSPRAVTDVWVHGRRVVDGGRLRTVALEALLERVRALTRGWRV
ncbi:MAG TPA: amidohydrolase family protein [Candidatus Tectomicrobia bacterium]|nr:amidohydrolase family protein [Candidatus Tectomicrobia bacterium]